MNIGGLTFDCFFDYMFHNYVRIFYDSTLITPISRAYVLRIANAHGSLPITRRVKGNFTIEFPTWNILRLYTIFFGKREANTICYNQRITWAFSTTDTRILSAIEKFSLPFPFRGKFTHGQAQRNKSSKTFPSTEVEQISSLSCPSTSIRFPILRFNSIPGEKVIASYHYLNGGHIVGVVFVA